MSNAKIFIHVNGYLEEIKRIEVQENAIPTPGAESIRVVLKPNKEERLIQTTEEILNHSDEIQKP